MARPALAGRSLSTSQPVFIPGASLGPLILFFLLIVVWDASIPAFITPCTCLHAHQVSNVTHTAFDPSTALLTNHATAHTVSAAFSQVPCVRAPGIPTFVQPGCDLQPQRSLGRLLTTSSRPVSLRSIPAVHTTLTLLLFHPSINHLCFPSSLDSRDCPAAPHSPPLCSRSTLPRHSRLRNPPRAANRYR